MKTLLLILLLVPMMSFGQNVYIPDANFKNYLVNNTAINTNGDSEIQVSEASGFSGTINCGWQNISDLSGIEAFTSLTQLFCFNNQLTSLDLSSNNALNLFECTYNQLTSLNVSGCNSLIQLGCANNQLTSLDVSNNNVLEYLYCANNQLTSIDVSNDDLIELSCSNNQLTSLDFSSNMALTLLNCANNQLTSLDVSSNTALIEIDCEGNNLTSLDVYNNIYLTSLSCGNNLLTSLDISSCAALIGLFCFDNEQLQCLNLKNGNNMVMTLYLFGNPNLTCIDVDDENYSANNWTGSNIDSQVSFSNDCGNDCSSSLDISELNNTPKQLIKIVDVLGRETPFKPNTPLLYIYNDGTVERKMIIEE